jgi:pyruvate dehydrogenase E1 component beta subunit
MKTMKFSEAIDDVLVKEMERDPRIVLWGEDIAAFRLPLYTRFGKNRVRSAPISEAGFMGAAVGAAMAGQRPVVELWLVDFVTVALDALVNHAAKTEVFSGGRWKAPLVVRAPCGGGYGDAGQHEQSLWGWLAHIPGLSVVVPSNPADAGGLMLSALRSDGPVVFCEHKLLSERHLEYLVTGGRKNLRLNIPAAGASGPVPRLWEPVPLGSASVCREGRDLTLISLGIGVHRCLEAAGRLEEEGISSCVIDLRSVSPLDKATVLESVAQTGRMLVVDEDYRGFGLSGELAAVVLEEGVKASYARVCTEGTIPFAKDQAEKAVPHTQVIVEAGRRLVGAPGKV